MMSGRNLKLKEMIDYNGADHSFTGVVYFDQQMGAPHAVCWSKSFFYP